MGVMVRLQEGRMTRFSHWEFPFGRLNVYSCYLYNPIGNKPNWVSTVEVAWRRPYGWRAIYSTRVADKLPLLDLEVEALAKTQEKLGWI